MLGLALCAVPVSIAVTETLLAVALAARIPLLVNRRAGMHAPRLFWFWLVWAVLEVVSWLRSPETKAGWDLGAVEQIRIGEEIFYLVRIEAG
jgi:hypothetical protein